MALESGSRLGPYEILSLIGAGGLGEEYKARDTKLGREVGRMVQKLRFPRPCSRKGFRLTCLP